MLILTGNFMKQSIILYYGIFPYLQSFKECFNKIVNKSFLNIYYVHGIGLVRRKQKNEKMEINSLEHNIFLSHSVPRWKVMP